MQIKDFVNLLGTLYGMKPRAGEDWLREWAAAENLPNGTVIEADIEPNPEFVEYEEWLKEEAPPNPPGSDMGPAEVLADAVYRGVLEPGLYLISYSW